MHIYRVLIGTFIILELDTALIGAFLQNADWCIYNPLARHRVLIGAFLRSADWCIYNPLARQSADWCIYNPLVRKVLQVPTGPMKSSWLHLSLFVVSVSLAHKWKL